MSWTQITLNWASSPSERVSTKTGWEKKRQHSSETIRESNMFLTSDSWLTCILGWCWQSPSRFFVFLNLTFHLPLGQVQVLYYAKNYFQINDKVKPGNQIRPVPGAAAPHFFFSFHLTTLSFYTPVLLLWSWLVWPSSSSSTPVLQTDCQLHTERTCGRLAIKDGLDKSRHKLCFHYP